MRVCARPVHSPTRVARARGERGGEGRASAFVFFLDGFCHEFFNIIWWFKGFGTKN